MKKKKELQDNVRTMHSIIEWLLSPIRTEHELDIEISEHYPGLSFSGGTRNEKIKIILKGKVSEFFHPGL